MMTVKVIYCTTKNTRDVKCRTDSNYATKMIMFELNNNN